MSLDGAMLTGISALDANSQAMSIYSSNIANVNTIGYKDLTANFSDMLSSMFDGVANAGVETNGQQNITQQGLLQTASSPTDMGIQGNGFFVVSNSAAAGGNQYYTRVGNFTPDANGNLANGAGYYLMGYPVTNGTTSSTLGAINVNNIPGTAEKTANVSLSGANLDSSATADTNYVSGDMTAGNVQPELSQTVNIFDSLGGQQPVTINWVNISGSAAAAGAPNTWAYEVDYGGSASNLSAPNPVTEGIVSFNSSGQLASVNGQSATGTINFSMPWATSTGLASQSINLDLGTIGSTSSISQLSGASTAGNPTVDGEPYGTVSGVTISTSGMVTANFTNGMTQQVAQIPLATFENADGLSALSGGAYQASANSGAVNIGAANSGSAGTIQSGELEGSTVDLATEFTNLITTERAYSAASRIVTTADTMLQTLEQLPST